MPFETPNIAGSHVYEHLGVWSQPLDDQSGETVMPVDDDIRVGGALRAAPLGLAFENGVASYLFSRVIGVPTQIALHVCDDGAGVGSIRSVTRIVRQGRTMVVTDGEIHDGDDPDRLLAYGSINWAVTGPAPEGARPGGGAPRPAHAPRGIDLMAAVGIEPLDGEPGCRLEGVSPQIAGPGGILHAGMFQLLCEEAALVAGRGVRGGAALRAADCAYDFLTAGKIGPFVARAEVLKDAADGVHCRVLVTDEDQGRLCAHAFVRVTP